MADMQAQITTRVLDAHYQNLLEAIRIAQAKPSETTLAAMRTAAELLEDHLRDLAQTARDAEWELLCERVDGIPAFTTPRTPWLP